MATNDGPSTDETPMTSEHPRTEIHPEENQKSPSLVHKNGNILAQNCSKLLKTAQNCSKSLGKGGKGGEGGERGGEGWRARMSACGMWRHGRAQRAAGGVGRVD